MCPMGFGCNTFLTGPGDYIIPAERASWAGAPGSLLPDEESVYRSILHVLKVRHVEWQIEPGD